MWPRALTATGALLTCLEEGPKPPDSPLGASCGEAQLTRSTEESLLLDHRRAHSGHLAVIHGLAAGHGEPAALRLVRFFKGFSL